MAQYKTEVLKQGRHFKLTMCVKSRTAKRHYVIALNGFGAARDVEKMGGTPAEIAKIVDPHGNRTIKGGRAWKLYSKEEAETLFTFVTVKWG